MTDHECSWAGTVWQRRNGGRLTPQLPRKPIDDHGWVRTRKMSLVGRKGEGRREARMRASQRRRGVTGAISWGRS